MEPGSHNPTVAQAILSAELKSLRSAKGETQEAVATACEWSVAKFVQIENGTLPVRKADLKCLLRHYGISGDRAKELVERARQARAPGWWEDFNFGTDKGFEAYVGYEDGASSIRMFEAQVVPELLQTPQYAVQTMKDRGVPPKAILSELKLREERKQRVAIRGPVQCYILDETVIRYPVGTAMPEQLRHLARMAQLPAVTIRIIPHSMGPHFGMRGPFVLLGFDGPVEKVLYLQSTRRGDLLITGTKEQIAGPNVPKLEGPADEVARYEAGFQSLLKLALDPAKSLELIDSVREN